jgi:hypothetical protein
LIFLNLIAISLSYYLQLQNIEVVARKKEIPYKEDRNKDIGAHVGYTVIWGRVSKVVRAGVQMCYYPAEPPFHVMAVLSRTCVVRVLCAVIVAP